MKKSWDLRLIMYQSITGREASGAARQGEGTYSAHSSAIVLQDIVGLGTPWWKSQLLRRKRTQSKVCSVFNPNIFPLHIQPPHKNTQPHHPFPPSPPSSKSHRAGSRSPSDPTGGCPRTRWWSSPWRSRSSPWVPWAPRWQGWWPPASTRCPQRSPGWRPRSDRCRNCSPRCWWYPPGNDRNDRNDPPDEWRVWRVLVGPLGMISTDVFDSSGWNILFFRNWEPKVWDASRLKWLKSSKSVLALDVKPYPQDGQRAVVMTKARKEEIKKMTMYARVYTYYCIHAHNL